MGSRIECFQQSTVAKALVFGSGAALLCFASFKLYQLVKTPVAPGRFIPLKTALKNPIVLGAGGAGTVITAGGIAITSWKTGTPLKKTDRQKLEGLGLKFADRAVTIDLSEDTPLELLKEAAAAAKVKEKIAIVLGSESDETQAFIDWLTSDTGLKMPKEKVLKELKTTDLTEVQKGAVVFSFPGATYVAAIAKMLGDKKDEKILDKVTVQQVTVAEKEEN